MEQDFRDFPIVQTWSAELGTTLRADGRPSRFEIGLIRYLFPLAANSDSAVPISEETMTRRWVLTAA